MTKTAQRIRFELTPEQKASLRQIRTEVESERDEILAQAREHLAADLAAITRLQHVFRLLQATRKAQGISLSELAQRTGISKPALSRLENDPAPNVTLATLQRYAAALGKELVISLTDAEGAKARGSRPTT